MSLILRPNEFSLTDDSVIWRHPDGRELHVGRISSDKTQADWQHSRPGSGRLNSSTKEPVGPHQDRAERKRLRLRLSSIAGIGEYADSLAPGFEAAG